MSHLLRLSTFALIFSACSTLPAQVPTPPAETPKAEQPQAKGADEAEATSTPIADLTHRYRFFEQYTKDELKVGPGVIGQYGVGIVEVFKDSVDTPEGKPKESETTRQTIFFERPAELSALGVVTASVRNYKRFQVRPDEPAGPAGPPLLDGLSVYYRLRNNDSPEVITLSADRRLRDREYEVIADQAFVPSLTAIFPSYPVRVGDTWRAAKRAVQAMIGDSSVRGDGLVAKFAELRRDVKTQRHIAVFTVSGRATNPYSELAINARIEFTFDPPAPLTVPEAGAAADATPAPTTPPRPANDALIEARGAITELRLARVARGILPDPTQRLTYTSNLELILHRKIGLAVTGGLPLELPEPLPAASDANTSIIYSDPASRFSISHPQDLLPPERFQLTGALKNDSLVLVKNRPDGKEMVRLDVIDMPREPESLQETLDAEWKRIKAEVLPGGAEWLPEADWPNGMKVYRIESALKLGTRGARMHYDAYLVKVSDKTTLTVIATTSRDAVGPFRKEVEKIIKSFKLNPPAAG